MKQSFYIFLCSLLGMLLLLLIQRSLFLLGYLVVGTEILNSTWQAWDHITFVAALFGGLWYGIWLGITWYRMIYQDKSEAGVVSKMKSWFAPKEIGQAPTWNLKDLIAQQSQEYGGRGLEIFERDIAVRTPVSAQSLHAKHRRVVKKPATPKKTKKV